MRSTAANRSTLHAVQFHVPTQTPPWGRPAPEAVGALDDIVVTLTTVSAVLGDHR